MSCRISGCYFMIGNKMGICYNIKCFMVLEWENLQNGRNVYGLH